MGWAWLAVPCMVLGLGACDRTPAKASLNGWPPGEPVVAGNCEFLLKTATLYHSTEWHLDVEVLAANVGTEKAYCSYSARAMTVSDTALTDQAKNGSDLGADEEEVSAAAAEEANVTGISSGAAEDAWVYVELSEGYWPMDTSVGVSVFPERIRPPS